MRRHAWILPAVIGLPWAGALLAGRDLSGLLRFPPPLEVPENYLKFSWWAVAAVMAGMAVVFAGWFGARPGTGVSRSGGRALEGEDGTLPDFRLPSWAWWAGVWMVAWWAIAWCRWPELAWMRRHSFFPLWLGFIVVVNGLTASRKGSCQMTRAPGPWLGLFGASAAFWWGFEWLNRFVRNWHYLGAEEFGPVGYAAHATLCFSTVLPAVAVVAELLGTVEGWTRRLAAGPTWPWLATARTGRILVAGGLVALLATGAFPSVFYPALWVAPLALYLGFRGRAGGNDLVAEVARGDWRQAGSWMAAALVCGGFWEMWNFFSLPKWIYTVPGVDRWHVFEMPVLGYAGYLPFGLECLAIVSALRRDAH